MNTIHPRIPYCVIALLATILLLIGCAESAPEPAPAADVLDPGVLQGLIITDDHIGWGGVITGMTAADLVTGMGLKFKFLEPMEGDLDYWTSIHLYDESIIWFDGKGLNVMVTRIFLPMPEGWDEAYCSRVLEQLVPDLMYAEGADHPGGDGAEAPSKLYLLTEHPDLGIRVSADGLWLGNQTVRAILPLTSPG